MSLQPGLPAPYTTVAALTCVLDAWRDRGLGTPITADVVVRAGVPESLGRRTILSLKQLDLVNDDGQPTQHFEDLRHVRGDDEYRSRLQEWLRDLYADILMYADPASDSLDRIAEQFRGYEPPGQRRAMATLFLGLWRYAGLPLAANDTPSPTTTRSRPKTGATASPKKANPTKRAPADASNAGASGLSDLPPGLVGLLHQIPVGGAAWTEARRDAFLTAFTAVLDFTIPIGEPATTRGDRSEEMPDEAEN